MKVKTMEEILAESEDLNLPDLGITLPDDDPVFQGVPRHEDGPIEITRRRRRGDQARLSFA